MLFLVIFVAVWCPLQIRMTQCTAALKWLLGFSELKGEGFQTEQWSVYKVDYLHFKHFSIIAAHLLQEYSFLFFDKIPGATDSKVTLLQ